jgi:hypothetical protein
MAEETAPAQQQTAETQTTQQAQPSSPPAETPADILEGGSSYTPPAVETHAGTQADEIRNTLANMGSFITEETRREMESQLASLEKPATPPQAAASAAEEPPAEPPADKKDDNTAPATDKKDDKAANEYKSKFGLKKPGGEKKVEPIVIETPDQMLGAIKTTFGMELKAPAELPKFFEVATGWRKDAEKLKTVEGTHQQILAEIEALPEEFHDAFQRMSSGQDWREAFTQKPKFDFNVPAEKQDVKALVEHYYPGKFTEEDFTSEEQSPLLEMAISTSKDKFTIEKTTYDNKRASVADETTKRLNTFKTSLAGSVNYLKQNFPDTEQDTVKSVSSILEGGPQSVIGFFFNKDGSVKQEAAESLMMAMYGKEEIQGMMEIAQHSRETQINEELLTRGADRPAPVQRQTAPGPQLSEADKQKVEEMKRLGKKDRVF